MSLCCGAKVGVGSALSRANVLPPAPAPAAALRLSFAWAVSSSSPLSLQCPTCPHAKRKPFSSAPPLQDDELVLDDDFKDSINQLSTDVVKTMLSDNMKRMDELREKLLDLELYFQKEKEEDELLFILVITRMLDHKIIPEAKQLKGVYLKAFRKICNIVEDSGWLLKGDENEFGVEMVDDELIPPTIMSEYR